MSDYQWAWLKAELGLTEEQRTDADARYVRLGTLRLVTIEYLRERRNALVSGVTSLSIPGALSVSLSANITALERWIKSVEAGPNDPSDPEDPPVDELPALRTMTMIPTRSRTAARRYRHPDTW